MKQTDIKLNGTYRLKPAVFTGSIQANGKPLVSADITIVRIKTAPGRERRWYFDLAGNAYRASDFTRVSDVIEVEL